MKPIDLTGNRYGRLTVIKKVPSNTKKTKWLCVCDCGESRIVQGGNLVSGNTTSCGCIQKERVREIRQTHGITRTKLHRAWSHIKTRCLNPNCKDWADYGGRGIKVCDEWRDSFEAFRDWALTHGYRDDLTIDRIDVNGNYEPSNCRWATAKAQGNNKRNNRIIEINGEAHTLTEWADIKGINPQSIRSRIARGWKPDRAVMQPFETKSQEREVRGYE